MICINGWLFFEMIVSALLIGGLIEYIILVKFGEEDDKRKL